VVNFELPKVPEDYIHRIGRTGRAGSQGEGISFVSADEVKLLSAIETLIRQTLEREVASGFIPKHKVPLSRQQKARPKKPKKPKQEQSQGKARKLAGGQKQASDKPRRGGKPQGANKPKGATGGRRRRT